MKATEGISIDHFKKNKSHVTIEEMSENTFWPSYQPKPD